jgi:hypothetical protein
MCSYKVKRTTRPSTFAEVVQESLVALMTKVGTIERLTWEEVVGIKEALLGKLDEYEPIPGSSLLSGHKDMAGTPGNPVPGCTVFWMVEIQYWNHSSQQLCSSSFLEKQHACTAEKNWDFLTSFSLSNKFTYLAYKISYRKKRNKRQSRENQNFADFISIPLKNLQRHLYCERILIKKSFLLGNEEWKPENFGFSAALTFISLLFRYEI